MNMTTAIIIDDHQMFSGGFKFILGSLGSITDVISFEDPQNAVESQAAEAVSLVVSDLYIPGYDMFVWIERLKATFKNACVVVISSSISRTDRTECLSAGADAYFEKHADPDIVVSGLERLLSRQKLDDKFLERTARDAQDMGLTQKQIDILVHLSRGLTVKEIAIRFKVSPETVKSHLARIYDTLGVGGRSAARDWAKRHGLV